MRASAILTFGIASLLAQAASAQLFDMPTSFRGFRVEANGGWDRFLSNGTHDNNFGYGGTVGFDGTIADKIVIGAEGTYWRERHDAQTCEAGVNGGTVCRRSFGEFGAAARAGYLVTPKLLVFGKGGFVSNKQHTSFDSPGTLLYLNGLIVGPETSYHTRGSTDGYQLGGGVEYSLTRMFYADVQYVYANYDDHSRREHAMVGLGVRF